MTYNNDNNSNNNNTSNNKGGSAAPGKTRPNPRVRPPCFGLRRDSRAGPERC